MLIVAGKGGVGKTTVCTTVARLASGLGLSVLVLSVEGSPSGAASAAVGPPENPIPAATAVFARLAPDEALVEYLESHGLGRLSRRLARSGVVEVAATAVPGIKDVLMLGKVRQLETAGVADLIVVDAPASGHAVRFLGGASGLAEIVTGGPLRAQSEQVAALLQDPRRCRVLLVTLAEETPVNEVAETAFALEDRAGVALDSVIVNCLLPAIPELDDDLTTLAGSDLVDGATGGALAAAARFRAQRQAVQDLQVARLGDALPLPQLHLPFLFGGVDSNGIDVLAGALAGALRSRVTAGDGP